MLIKDAARITNQRLSQSRLKDAFSRDPIDSKLSSNSTSDGTSAGGIASPLTEDDNVRAYYDAYELTSSDGLFVLETQHIKTAIFTDANDNSVQVDYDDPDS